MRIARLLLVFCCCQTAVPTLFSQNFLAPLDGPFGISVQNMIASAGGQVFVFSTQGNLFRSTDKGDTWAAADAGSSVVPYDMQGFLVDPAGNTYLVSSKTLLRYDANAAGWQATQLPSAVSNALKGAAVGPQGQVLVGAGNGQVFRSMDQGATFQQVLIAPNGIVAERLAAFNDAHNLFYGYSGGSSRLYHFSMDGTAQQVLSFQGTPKFLDFNPYTGTAFMASGSRVRRSKDGGLSWQDITPDQPYLGDITQIRFLPAGGGWAVNDQGRIFYMASEGDTWVALNIPGNVFDFYADQLSIAPDGAIYLANSLWCGTNIFTRSTDGGNTWTLLDNNFRHPTTSEINVDPSGQIYASTCMKGQLRSGDAGKSWALARIAPQGPVLTRIATGENGILFGAGDDNVLYCSLNNGLSWNNVTPAGFSEDPENLILSIAPDGTLYCTGITSMYRSADFGAHWQVFFGDIVGISPTQFFYHPNGHIYVFQFGTVFRSDDRGEHWTTLFGDYIFIDAFHLDPSGNIWFYGSNSTTLIEAIYLSKDEGATVTAQGLTDYGVHAITSNAAGDIFATSKSNTLYRRKNGVGGWGSLGLITNSGALNTGLYVDSKQYLYSYFDNDVVYRSLTPTANANFIRGQVLLDADGNCQLNAGETPVSNWVVTATGNQTYTAYTRSDGRYTLTVPDGTYHVNLTPPNSLWKPCKSDVTAIFTASNDSSHIDFPAKAASLCPLPTVAVSTAILRRCAENTYFVQYCNEGTASLLAAQLEVELDPLFDFISAGLPVVTQAGQKYTFDIGNLEPGQCGTSFIKIKVSCDAVLGAEHCLLAHILPEADCQLQLPWQARTRDCRPNVGSYDPNDKRAFVDGREVSAHVAPDTLVEYLIRFQNTGTDTAFRVVVEDRLSPLLDARRVTPLLASHPYSLDIVDGRTLRFTFDPIALPDSNVNEPASHGFVKFRVAQRPGNPLGALLENTARIFFDSNDPVSTNTQQLTLFVPSVHTDEPSNEGQIRVFPNPFHAATTFEVLSPGAGTEHFVLSISNPLGRAVRRETFQGPQIRLDRQGMPDGLYFFRIEAKDRLVGSGKILLQGN